MNEREPSDFEKKLINFFNSRKYFWIKKILDFASIIILIIVLYILISRIELLTTNPCELCEDMGYVCFRSFG